MCIAPAAQLAECGAGRSKEHGSKSQHRRSSGRAGCAFTPRPAPPRDRSGLQRGEEGEARKRMICAPRPGDGMTPFSDIAGKLEMLRDLADKLRGDRSDRDISTRGHGAS